MTEFGEKVQEIALQLTEIVSVVGTEGEVRIAEAVYQKLNHIAYFQENPHLLQLKTIEDDPLGRKFVLAVVEGKKAKRQESVPAVLCLGHIDTVGILDYGDLKEFANQPGELKKHLKTIQFSSETLAEINSPDWLFGRGLLDMKTGVAAHMVMAEHFAARCEDLAGDLVFIFVPDEEGDSAGMLAAVKTVAELVKQKNYHFLTALNTDYTTARYPGDEHRYVYVGTVGKLLPCFYLYGEETHVGEAFNGVDANLLSSEVLYEMDYNTDLCDSVDGEVTLPPVCLYQRDLKQEYSVQTANAVTLYFNCFTHSSEPEQVLKQCLGVANSSFENVIKRLNEQYEKYCKLTKIPYHRLPWKPCVMTYEELYRQVKAEIGAEIDLCIEKLTRQLLAEGVDEREFSLKIVEEVHRHYSNQDSKIIVYFAPPYYPHNYVKGEDRKEQVLLTALNEAIDEARKAFGDDIVIKKFFPYISDLSFCRISRDSQMMRSLTENMPAWPSRYKLPVEAIQAINMPVANIGPFGKDAHKLSERLFKPYSFETMPVVLQKTIENLLIP